MSLTANSMDCVLIGFLLIVSSVIVHLKMKFGKWRYIHVSSIKLMETSCPLGENVNESPDYLGKEQLVQQNFVGVPLLTRIKINCIPGYF